MLVGLKNQGLLGYTMERLEPRKGGLKIRASWRVVRIWAPRALSLGTVSDVTSWESNKDAQVPSNATAADWLQAPLSLFFKQGLLYGHLGVLLW